MTVFFEDPNVMCGASCYTANVTASAGQERESSARTDIAAKTARH